ncbi:MAG: pectate lyase [Bacteroidales bacterium]|nr:pectate lyase [Bacteroidales bacterium]
MKTLLKTTIALLLTGCVISSALAQRGQTTEQRILAAVKQATTYMLDEVSYRGGFVWSYLPDLSRQWGEMEAYRTMAWTQEGTPEVGELMLDLYIATGDEYYYQAAEKIAAALIWGQHPSGGWSYIIDFAGDASIRQWYNTIGKNGIRLEEFHHYYGNCTYDDDATALPARFILRLYSMKHDPKYRASVEQTLDHLLKSQYPIGGWPQRYPLNDEFSKNGIPSYTSYITFNDEVHKNNVDLLILYYRVLGKKELLEPILRAMNCVIALQQGAPNPGWGDQHDHRDYKPTHARGFEPPHINTRNTYWMCDNLMDFYQQTGESKFLVRVPEAMNWLESLKLPNDHPSVVGNARSTPNVNTTPMFIEPGTNKYIRSHVENGRYIINYDRPGMLAYLNMNRLRDRYNTLIAMSVDEATADSDLLTDESFKFPDWVTRKRFSGTPTLQEVNDLIAKLVNGKYWLVPIPQISHPFVEQNTDLVTRAPRNVNDMSPYAPDPPVMGITTRSYIQNIARLMTFLQSN